MAMVVYIYIYHKIYLILMVPTDGILQIIIVEFLGKFTSTVRLNWKHWLACLAIAIIR